jgi:hypothetical protein
MPPKINAPARERYIGEEPLLEFHFRTIWGLLNIELSSSFARIRALVRLDGSAKLKQRRYPRNVALRTQVGFSDAAAAKSTRELKQSLCERV